VLGQVRVGAVAGVVGPVSRRRDGDGPAAPPVAVAQVVRDLLEPVLREVGRVVPQDPVMRRPARPLWNKLA
jgi:hypothetical protein